MGTVFPVRRMRKRVNWYFCFGQENSGRKILKEVSWLKIGAAFEHKDGKGYNLTLQALPTDGRLVLREYKEPDSR